jgi:hypothetical protein
MKMLLAALLIVFGGAAMAQHHQHKQSPYADMQSRAIKALSEQQVADLMAGRGMGLALAAELNGYPGPLHVLELADGIGLSDQQREQVRALYEAMKHEAITAGQKLIDIEAELDRAFRERNITAERLAELTRAVGVAQAELRAVHLRYHLTTADVLDAGQAKRYAELRGYR